MTSVLQSTIVQTEARIDFLGTTVGADNLSGGAKQRLGAMMASKAPALPALLSQDDIADWLKPQLPVCQVAALRLAVSAGPGTAPVAPEDTPPSTHLSAPLLRARLLDVAATAEPDTLLRAFIPSTLAGSASCPVSLPSRASATALEKPRRRPPPKFIANLQNLIIWYASLVMCFFSSSCHLIITAPDAIQLCRNGVAIASGFEGRV